MTDSHERKAAIELQALRDDLIKLGFLKQPQHEQGATLQSSTVHQDFRTVRPMRQSPRVFRASRLSPVQRHAQVAADVHRWLRERFGVEQRDAITGKIDELKSAGQTESIKRAGSVRQAEQVKRAGFIRPNTKIKRSRVVKQVPQQEHTAGRKLGRGILSPRHTHYSHGIRM